MYRISVLIIVLPSLLLLMITSSLIWPNSTGKPTLHQAIAQNSTMLIDPALLAGDAIQALNHKDINRAVEHLKLIDEHLHTIRLWP